MKKYNSIVLFDVDGVLLDSLIPHLQICKDLSDEYQLGLLIPSAYEFKEIVRRGVTVTPMKLMFEAVGFSSADADRAVKDYSLYFMQRYAVNIFQGVDTMLQKLHSKKVVMGIITFNIRKNIESALGSNMRYFKPDLVLTKDSSNFVSKTNAILSLASQEGIKTKDILYIGDQPADYEAAYKAGAKFLGVTYGWGISKGYNGFPVANTISEVTSHIFKIIRQISSKLR